MECRLPLALSVTPWSVSVMTVSFTSREVGLESGVVMVFCHIVRNYLALGQDWACSSIPGVW
jgi:hypothetical protein